MTSLVIAGAVGGGTAIASTFLCGAALPFMRRFNVTDVAVDRSMHRGSVTRGVGVAMALASVAGFSSSAAVFGWARAFPILIVATTLMAGVGLLADIADIGAISRLGIQIAVLVLVCFFGLAVQHVAITTRITLDLGAAALGLSVVWLISVVNLWNFMDGIDGLAAGQTALAGVFLTTELLLSGRVELAAAACAMTGAALGFLPYNWSPARCFMGDAGSYFCGSAFGCLALLALQAGIPLQVVLLPSLPFLADGVVTLAARLVRGSNPLHPHRDHVYQRLALRMGHAAVTIWYLETGAACGALGLIWWLVSAHASGLR